MVVVHARLSVKPEARERWLELADAVTGPSRAEDACRSYQLFEAVETPGVFVFVEEWESIDGLHDHFHTAHFTELSGALGEVLAGPPEGWVHEVASTRTLDETLADAGIGA